MKGKRYTHSAAFKAQMALVIVKGDRTVSELASLQLAYANRSHPTALEAEWIVVRWA